MLKTALFDCAINEKCCSVDGGRGIRPLFSSPAPGDLTAQEFPPQRICHPRQKKKANARASEDCGFFVAVGIAFSNFLLFRQ